ncbi:MAG TPA: NADH-quinone oxidoreductase subunit NuoB [Planctomycetota bacterium]|nr:NADH-quinone oxidoreductase subunit NuoB [Planctomycetota bacterium]HUV39959.1 NADH-quinone oxidoreductase subunit NuoB [Planctomycetota bacterium]
MALTNWALRKSLWVYHVNAGACNNCDIEVLELLTPRYDIERFGMLLVGSPRHADVLAVTGVCTRQTMPRLQEVYMQTAKPCVVLCIGACACGQGIFTEAYHMGAKVDEAIKAVDPNAIIMYIPGCSPKPEAMIDAVVKGIALLKTLDK